jgi:hypothetical protein
MSGHHGWESSVVELERARDVLAELRPVETSIASEVGLRNHAAYLRLHVLAQPDRWAVIVTSGRTWSSLEVDAATLGFSGRFSLDSFHEDSPDEDVQATLVGYLAVARAYLAGSGVVIRSRRLRLPSLVVDMPQGSRNLRRSVANNLRDLLSPGHWLRRVHDRR